MNMEKPVAPAEREKRMSETMEMRTYLEGWTLLLKFLDGTISDFNPDWAIKAYHNRTSLSPDSFVKGDLDLAPEEYVEFDDDSVLSEKLQHFTEYICSASDNLFPHFMTGRDGGALFHLYEFLNSVDPQTRMLRREKLDERVAEFFSQQIQYGLKIEDNRDRKEAVIRSILKKAWGFSGMVMLAVLKKCDKQTLSSFFGNSDVHAVYTMIAEEQKS
jgi:hypothetical protein